MAIFDIYSWLPPHQVEKPCSTQVPTAAVGDEFETVWIRCTPKVLPLEALTHAVELLSSPLVSVSAVSGYLSALFRASSLPNSRSCHGALASRCELLGLGVLARDVKIPAPAWVLTVS